MSPTEVEVSRTPIIAWAVYTKDMAIYPVTVEKWMQEPNSGKIFFDYDLDLTSAVGIIIPAVVPMWQVDGTIDDIIYCIGVTSDTNFNPDEWVKAAIAAAKKEGDLPEATA